jgi:hypothetical protein
MLSTPAKDTEASHNISIMKREEKKQREIERSRGLRLQFALPFPAFNFQRFGITGFESRLASAHVLFKASNFCR